MLAGYLKANHPHIKNHFTFLAVVEDSTKTTITLWVLSSHKHGFGISAEWVFFATKYCKSPCDGIGGAVKRHVAKRMFERFLNNQISDYEAMLDLCESEMMPIKFFRISKESMISLENLEISYKGWGYCNCHTE